MSVTCRIVTVPERVEAQDVGLRQLLLRGGAPERAEAGRRRNRRRSRRRLEEFASRDHDFILWTGAARRPCAIP